MECSSVSCLQQNQVINLFHLYICILSQKNNKNLTTSAFLWLQELATSKSTAEHFYTII